MINVAFHDMAPDNDTGFFGTFIARHFILNNTVEASKNRYDRRTM